MTAPFNPDKDCDRGVCWMIRPPCVTQCQVGHREQWKFICRETDDNGFAVYVWERMVPGYAGVHTVPVSEFWPTPKPVATIRPNSILDWITRFFERPEPGTKADYALAAGKATR